MDVAKALVRTALAKGHRVVIWDGVSETEDGSRDMMYLMPPGEVPDAALEDVLGRTEEDNIYLTTPEGQHLGTLWLIWGNDPSGEDLVADMTSTDAARDVVDDVSRSFGFGVYE
jgi:NAD(P)-dependent dehydrogenase (short-subunit alcohol dehydrogenase family)